MRPPLKGGARPLNHRATDVQTAQKLISLSRFIVSFMLCFLSIAF